MKKFTKIFAASALALTGCATMQEIPSNDEVARRLRATAKMEFGSMGCDMVIDSDGKPRELARKDEGREVTICYDLICKDRGHALGCMTDSYTNTGGKARTTRVLPY